MGYLKIEEWAYGLALLAYMRDETNPDWANYLSSGVKPEFDSSLSYMFANPKEIFQLDE